MNDKKEDSPAEFSKSGMGAVMKSKLQAIAIRRLQNVAAILARSLQPTLALLLIMTLQLSWLPHQVTAQTRLDDQRTSVFAILREAEKLANDKGERNQLAEAEKLLADGGGEAAFSSSGLRVKGILRHLIDHPSSESNDDLKQKVAEALRLLEAYAPSFSGGVRASTEAAYGLHSTVFNMLEGTVTVNLPADLAQGDSISGTVIAEATGRNDTERANNQAALSGYVVQIDKEEVSTEKQVAKLEIPDAQTTLPISLRNKDGKELARAVVAVNGAAKPNEQSLVDRGWGSGNQPSPIDMGRSDNRNSGQATGKRVTEPPAWAGPITLRGYQFPTIAQAGKPLLVKGKFDGDLTTSAVNIRNSPTRVLAESPRGVIAICPSDVSGKAEISVWENQKILAKGVFTSLAIRLSAEKLKLLRGEQTTMTVTVQGVEGLEAPATVRLTNTSPWSVRMSGGETQTFTVTPDNSKASYGGFNGGVFTTTRTLTGVQPGGFSIIAVVVAEEARQGDSAPGEEDMQANSFGHNGPGDRKAKSSAIPSFQSRPDSQLRSDGPSPPSADVSRLSRERLDDNNSGDRDIYRASPCDLARENFLAALGRVNFEIQTDSPVVQPGQIFNVHVVTSTSGAHLDGTELTFPGLEGIPLGGNIEVRWRVTNPGDTDLDPSLFAVPDGPESLRSPTVRLAIAPFQVVEAGTEAVPAVRSVVWAGIRVSSSCSRGTLTASAGTTSTFTSELIALRRQVETPAIQIPTIAALFRLPNFSAATTRLLSHTNGAALIVTRPGFRAGHLQPNTLLGTVALDPLLNLHGPVLQYLSEVNHRLGELRTLFPRNSIVQQLETYRQSLARLSDTLPLMSPVGATHFIAFRSAEELPELNFPFIENRDFFLDNVNVEDEVRSLILVGPPGRTLEIFNSPRFVRDEGALSITVGNDSFSALIPNLSTFTDSWAESNPDGALIGAGGFARVLSPPRNATGPRLLLDSFDREISSLRLR